MSKLYVLFVSLLFWTLPAVCQEKANKILLPSPPAKSFGIKKKTTRFASTIMRANAMTAAPTCEADTILYPYLKELKFSAPNDSFFIDAMVGNVREASQAYHLPQPATIKGVQFWGAAYSISPDPQVLSVSVQVNSVDEFNMPTTILGSATGTITHEYKFYTVLFATPIAVSRTFPCQSKTSSLIRLPLLPTMQEVNTAR